MLFHRRRSSSRLAHSADSRAHAYARRLLFEPLEDRRVLAPFTPGNLAVYRVGDGTQAPTANGNSVFIDEYTPAGVLVQSIAMPTTQNGAQRQLIASGMGSNSAPEGLITLSPNANFLMVTGYGVNLGGSTSLVTTNSTAVPRVIGRINAQGNVDTSTALTDFGTSVINGAVTTNGADIWVSSSSRPSLHLTWRFDKHSCRSGPDNDAAGKYLWQSVVCQCDHRLGFTDGNSR